PSAIAADPNGNVAWYSDSSTGQGSYYYGTTTSSFTQAYEALFPANTFYSQDMTYADGSFWAAGVQEFGGFGRISNVASGTPVTSFYAMPVSATGSSDGQQLCGASAAAGIVWGTDCDFGNIDMLQYGAPTSGATATISSVRRLGQQSEPRNTRLQAEMTKQRP
ncbi:MAG TPA: hypothetical protein VF741_05325, partial [Candidatus Aquilonibacter sp.]